MNQSVFIYILIQLIFSNYSYSQIPEFNFSRQDSAIFTELIEKSISYQKQGRLKSESDCYNDIAMILWEHNKFSEAILYYNKSISINKSLANDNAIAMINSNLVLIYADKNEYEKALQYFTNTLNIRKVKNERIGIISAHINISVVLNKLKRYKESTEHLKNALDIAREVNDIKQMRSCYGMLSETFEKKGDYKQSMYYFELYRKFNEIVEGKKVNEARSIAKEERLKKELAEKESKIKELLIISKNYEIVKKDKIINKTIMDKISLLDTLNEKELKIKFIENEGKLQLAESDRKLLKNKLLLRNIIFSSVILLLIISILIYYVLQKKKTNLKLAKKNSEIIQKNVEISLQANELEHKNLKLNELGEFKESMTNMIVHDLKNPLNSIIGLSENYNENLEQRQFKRNAKSVNQSGKQMLNLVTNILEVHKFNETEIILNYSNFTLYNVSLSAIKEVSFLIQQKNISLTNNIYKSISINADEQMLIRVFVNILSNAIKYSPNNGNINISAEIDNESHVVINIKDSGQGISKNQASKIFDKYMQADAKMSGSTHSTGIGLTYCKMAIEAHKGDIYVKSELGEGAEFIFSLPNVIKLKKDKKKGTTIKNQLKKIEFSDSDKKYLTPFINELKNIDVSEVSEFNNLFEQIEDKNQNIIKWKNKIEDAVFFCNDKQFLELIVI